MRPHPRDAAGLALRAPRAPNRAERCGRRRQGGDRRYHWNVAAGSASEATVALQIAVARRYITEQERAEVDELLDRVRAMLYRMTR